MSVFYVARWSVSETDVSSCETALASLAEHVASAHPGILSARVYRELWGPQPRRSFTWLEEFDSLSALEREPETPACAEAWAPIHRLALPATFVTAIWSDVQRGLWFDRRDQ
jgi:hypothetical protein